MPWKRRYVGSSAVLALGFWLGDARSPHAFWSAEFSSPGQLTGPVRALAVYRGELVSGGEGVVTEDGAILHRLGSWDGARWGALGGGVTHSACPGPPCWALVSALQVYGEDLIAGGNFIRAGGQPANYVAAWNGSTWRALGQGTDGYVRAFVVDGDDLYVGGEFTQAGGAPAANIARWDGSSWHSMGEGLCCGIVLDLELFEGRVVAAGRFMASGMLSGVAMWDGGRWEPLVPVSEASSMRSLAVYEGSLVASGNFLRWEDPFLVPYRVCRWTGSEWLPLGPLSIQPPGLLVVHDGRLLSSLGAGLNVWDGTTWTEFAPAANGLISELLSADSTLYIGGYFTEAGGVRSPYVARWIDDPTPVLLQDLSATRDAEGSVVLEWRFADRTEIESVVAERAHLREGPFVAVSPRLPADPRMSFVDRDALAGTAYWYRLAVATRTGGVEHLGPFAAGSTTGVLDLRLDPIPVGAPGPLTIRYGIGRAHDAYRLAVYDVRGRLVRTLAAGRAVPGQHVVLWHRDDDAGRPIARGTYWVQLAPRQGRAIAERVVLLGSGRTIR